MVKAWIMDEDVVTDRRQPHQPDNPKFLTVKCLSEYGVDYWKIESDEQLNKVIGDGKFKYNDEVICSKGGMENYEEMIEKFYEEHLHTDHETRLILEGTGYFDFRKPDTDQWVRVRVSSGEMISLPAGLYHRFTPDTGNYVKAKRFFGETPVWTPFPKAEGIHEAHKQYLEKVLKK